MRREQRACADYDYENYLKIDCTVLVVGWEEVNLTACDSSSFHRSVLSEWSVEQGNGDVRKDCREMIVLLLLGAESERR